MKVRNKQKISLVLSGGGIKAAAFHIGVCLALQTKGFKFAGGTQSEVKSRFKEDDPLIIRQYVGSSAGSFISAILASGYSVEALVHAFEVGLGSGASHFEPRYDTLRPIRYRDLFAVNGSNFISSIPSLLKVRPSLITGGLEALFKSGLRVNGLFTTKGIEKYFRRNVLFTNSFSDLGVELFIVGTQLNHSRKAIFGSYSESHKSDKIKYVGYANISDAVAASTSLPPVFAPYPIANEKKKDIYYFDGEIRDTLSTHVASDHGSDLVIASYSVQPYHFNKEIGSLHNYGIPVILNQALYQVIQQKIDKHIDYQTKIKSVYSAVEGFFNQKGLPPDVRDQLLEIIEKRAGFKKNVDTVYIHPSPLDDSMFFADHFSLNPARLEQVVRSGFKAAISTLRHYEF